MGGWFRTARVGRAVQPTKAWGPPEDASFGLRSSAEAVREAAESLRGRPTMVLTGAGTSTASGLPDYRGRGAIPRSPMTYQEFVSSDSSRRHYWARSTVGWPSFRVAQPNRVHELVADLGRILPVTGVVTQNVDGLHQAAGSGPVLDLHGRLASVSCLSCGAVMDREALQTKLLAMNPDVARRADDLARQAAALPDGDAEVDRTEEFVYPHCPLCGGLLKPDVVIVNDGATRGDHLASHRIHGELADVLQDFLAVLAPRPAD